MVLGQACVAGSGIRIVCSRWERWWTWGEGMGRKRQTQRSVLARELVYGESARYVELRHAYWIPKNPPAYNRNVMRGNEYT